MNFRPLNDRVAIQAMEIEEKTTGGIIIPDNAQEKPIKGKVVAVGNGAKDANGKIVPLEVKAGDIVLYGKWGNTEIKVEGQDLVIMKESDIVGILSK